MRILVTGSNGLLGNHLVRELLNDGHEVRALVRPTSQTRALDGLNAERVFGDVRDYKSVRAAMDGCEWVFHAAAVFAYFGYSKDDMMTTATEGTLNVLRAAKDAGVKRLMLTSSTAVLGGSETPVPLSESAAMLKSNMPDYFISKAQQEILAINEAKSMGLDLVVANPTVFVGPYDYRPSTSLSTFTGYIKDPVKMTYPGGINLAHAADIARGHLLLANVAKPYERHILGGENWQWPTLHRTMAELLGLKTPRFTASRSAAYVGATFMELGAKLRGKQPLATRGMAKQVGRYFWYSCDKARSLGYIARPSRTTMTETLGWLLDSTHLTEAQRAALKPSGAVLDARDHFRALERAQQSV